MRKIGDIHVFDDPAFLHEIKRDSLIVLVAGLLVIAGWGLCATMLISALDAPLTAFELDAALGTWGLRIMGQAGEATVSVAWWVSLVVATFASLGLHELVHAVFFKRFAPPGTRIRFGAHRETGMLYASADKVLYRREQYIVIALAPSIVVTVIVLALGFGLHWPLWAFVVATAHLSGCTGDWGYVRALRRDPAITHCLDTEYGVEFYGPGPHRKAPVPEQGKAGKTAASKGTGLSVVDGGKSS